MGGRAARAPLLPPRGRRGPSPRRRARDRRSGSASCASATCCGPSRWCAPGYEALKRRLAETCGGSRERYTAGKSDFVWGDPRRPRSSSALADAASPSRPRRRPLLVTALTVRTVRLRLRAPLRAAWGSLHERELVQVRLLFSDSDFGDGEAAPLEPYDGVPLAAVLAALDAYAAVLRDARRLDPRAAARRLPGGAAAPPGARGDRPGAVGSRGPSARAAGGGAAGRAAVRPRRRSRSTRRSAPRTARVRRRPPARRPRRGSAR